MHEAMHQHLGRGTKTFLLVFGLLAWAFLAGALWLVVANAYAAPQYESGSVALHAARSSPLDLEVGGELAGVEKGGTRYISRDDLLALSGVKFTVSGDENFVGPVEVRGVPLEELAKHLGESPQSDLVVAICDDLYRANYSRAYLAAHHPALVLEINGQPPDRWPQDAETQSSSMGPYMITHEHFTPRFKILSHPDEPQVPWGVVRLEFRNEERVFRAIAPVGANANSPEVQAGFAIAKQNCFRCHNKDGEGGQKAGRPWLVLSAWATADADYFRGYVHNPQSKNPRAQMPAFPDYDAPTLDALRAYFSTFTSLPAAAPHPGPEGHGAKTLAPAAAIKPAKADQP
ncbi:MAG: c-type cytochrome [Candidatus Acidiferrum sp.]